MQGLIMDMPLMISAAIRHAATFHGGTEVVARTIEGDIHRYDYSEAHARMQQLAHALLRLGIRSGDRIGSLAWNTHRHFEMFYGVSGTGAVLHTINPRLFADQLVYIINHAEDRLLFVDAATLPVVEAIAPRLTTIEHYVMMCEPARMPAKTSLPHLLCYDELLAAESTHYDWPEFDERSASTLCYTSGTTGNPKGVLYSHRSALLVALQIAPMAAIGVPNGAGVTMMPMAPMFHGNAWQFPYVAPMLGAKLVLPGRNYEPDKLYELLEGERVTLTCGVPTFWLILTEWLQRTGKKFSTLRISLSSGSAPPRSLIETMERDHGVQLMQAWGMTEALGGSAATMKPGAADLPFEQRIDQRLKSGRALFGNRYRIVDDEGKELPHDGVAFGHLRVKAPWVSSGLLQGRRRQRGGRAGLAEDRRPGHHRPRRLHLADRPLEGRDQVRRRMDQQHRAGERGLRPPGGAAGRGHRHRPPEVAGAATAGGDEARGRVAERGRADRLHARQGRQLVAARRRGLRRADAAHRHRQAVEAEAARAVQGLRAEVMIHSPALSEAIAFAQAHEMPWPRDPAADPAHWGVHHEDPPPYNVLRGPVHGRGPVSGVVWQHGREVAAWGEPERAELTFSVAKTYLALLAGVAQAQGLLPDADEPVVERVRGIGFDIGAQPPSHLDHAAAADQRVGRQLLRPARHGRPLSQGRLRPAPAQRPQGRCAAAAPPGSYWEYNDVRINQLSLALLHLFGAPLPEVFREQVMRPIGASEDWAWLGYDDAWVELPATAGRPARRVQSVPGGTHWGGGVSIGARDQARLGQLLLDGGSHAAGRSCRRPGCARCSNPAPLRRSTAGCSGSTATGSTSPGHRRKAPAWSAPEDT